jgi:hypothetical protein
MVQMSIQNLKVCHLERSRKVLAVMDFVFPESFRDARTDNPQK